MMMTIINVVEGAVTTTHTAVISASDRHSGVHATLAIGSNRLSKHGENSSCREQDMTSGEEKTRQYEQHIQPDSFLDWLIYQAESRLQIAVIWPSCTLFSWKVFLFFFLSSVCLW